MLSGQHVLRHWPSICLRPLLWLARAKLKKLAYGPVLNSGAHLFLLLHLGHIFLSLIDFNDARLTLFLQHLGVVPVTGKLLWNLI